MKCDKDIHLPTDKENAGRSWSGWHTKESGHREFGDFTSHNSPTKKEGEREGRGAKTAARKMINVSRTARPSSILLSSLFGRH